MTIDRDRHPLLHQVADGARWLGADAFPSCVEWADEHEAWLRFIDAAGVLPRYLPRLKGPKERRDEVFAEIATAYFFAVRCDLSISEWEPRGESGLGEFLVGFDRQQWVFVEVKSPGWEAEIAEVEGRDSPRLQQPKYVQVEARSTAPWASVRHAVKKAYPKMPSTVPTMLVLKDDLMVELLDWSGVVEIALYAERSKGYTTGYLAEDGPFVDNRFEHLGGVGVLNVDLPASGVRYRFALYENPHALAAVAIPPEIARSYPRYKGLKEVL